LNAFIILNFLDSPAIASDSTNVGYPPWCAKTCQETRQRSRRWISLRRLADSPSWPGTSRRWWTEHRCRRPKGQQTVYVSEDIHY